MPIKQLGPFLILNILALWHSANASPVIGEPNDGHDKSSSDRINDINVLISSNILKDTQLFADGRPFHDINHFNQTGVRRDVVSLILLNKALRLGGYTGSIHYQPDSEYKRLISRIRKAGAVMMAEPVWRKHVESDPALLVSEPVIRTGEFEAGLYTSPNNQLALASSLPKPYSQFSATTSPHWPRDLEALDKLGIEKIHLSLYWKNMVKFVYAKRADFTLAPFQNSQDLSIQAYGVTLTPIKNVKVALSGSRHFIVSRKHPQGAQIYQHLQKGLNHLRNDGTITRAYTESGFFNNRVKDWQLLNANSTQAGQIE